jgi:hypothetical protein
VNHPREPQHGRRVELEPGEHHQREAAAAEENLGRFPGEVVAARANDQGTRGPMGANRSGSVDPGDPFSSPHRLGDRRAEHRGPSRHGGLPDGDSASGEAAVREDPVERLEAGGERREPVLGADDRVGELLGEEGSERGGQNGALKRGALQYTE